MTTDCSSNLSSMNSTRRTWRECRPRWKSSRKRPSNGSSNFSEAMHTCRSRMLESSAESQNPLPIRTSRWRMTYCVHNSKNTSRFIRKNCSPSRTWFNQLDLKSKRTSSRRLKKWWKRKNHSSRTCKITNLKSMNTCRARWSKLRKLTRQNSRRYQTSWRQWTKRFNKWVKTKTSMNSSMKNSKTRSDWNRNCSKTVSATPTRRQSRSSRNSKITPTTWSDWRSRSKSFRRREQT